MPAGRVLSITMGPLNPRPGLNGECGIGVIVGESERTSVYIGCCHSQSLHNVSLYSTITVSSFGTEAVQSNPQDDWGCVVDHGTCWTLTCASWESTKYYNGPSKPQTRTEWGV